MAEIKEKRFMGHKVVHEHVFSNDGNVFSALSKAKLQCARHGLSSGSLDGDNPVALMKGKYTIAEKWRNLVGLDKIYMDGVLISDDFRHGSVKVLIFE